MEANAYFGMIQLRGMGPRLSGPLPVLTYAEETQLNSVKLHCAHKSKFYPLKKNGPSQNCLKNIHYTFSAVLTIGFTA